VAERFTTRRAAEAWISLRKAELIIVGVVEEETSDAISRFLALAPGTPTTPANDC
jgi:hypothetical protein